MNPDHWLHLSVPLVKDRWPRLADSPWSVNVGWRLHSPEQSLSLKVTSLKGKQFDENVRPAVVKQSEIPNHTDML